MDTVYFYAEARQSNMSTLFLLFVLTVFAVVNVQSSPCQTKDLLNIFGGSTLNNDYIKWATFGCDRYEQYMYIPTISDESFGSAIHWKANEAESILYLAVAVRLPKEAVSTNDRWVGFGISEVGGMYGSDLALYESSKPTIIQDGYIQDERLPLIDTPTASACADKSLSASNGNQDWNYVNVTSTKTFLIVEMSRKLDTGDSLDHPIMIDRSLEVLEQRIIVAWGTTSTVSYHGKNKVRGAIRWFGTGASTDPRDFHKMMLAEKADGFVDFIVPNYTIPNVETTYASFCFFFDDYDFPDSTNIVGYDAILGSDIGRKHIHHYLFEGSRVPREEVTDCFVILPKSELMWPDRKSVV